MFFSNKNKIKEMISLAIDKIESNDMSGAIETLTEVIKISPKENQFYCFRGNVYYELNMFNEAIDDYQKTLSLNPNNEEAMTNLAGCKRQNGDMKGAYRDYTNIIKRFPRNSIAWYNRGHIKRYLTDIVGARQDFQTAANLGDSDSLEWVEKCSYFDNSKSADELMKIIPLNANELIIEGMKNQNAGNLEIALGLFSRADELYPLLTEAYYLKTLLERKLRGQ